MNQEIKYSGFSAVPSDYECPDGSLAVSINLLPEDGALQPLLPPSQVFALTLSQSAIYIHKGTGYVNYIISNASDKGIRLSCFGQNDSFLNLSNNERIIDISSIGNMLLVSTNLSLHYIYYKDNKYTYLGNELPKINMAFALSAQLVSCEHKTPLTFSDYVSSESTWTTYANASFDTDMQRSSSAPYITSTIARDVKINLQKNIEAGTEYKIQVSGSGFTQVYLEAAKSGSADYEQVAVIDNGGTTRIKPGSTYTSFKATIFQSNGGVPSTHASGTIKVLSGFDNSVTGKVIEYNETNYNAVAAAVNKFVSERAIQKSKFIYPFFVRYALRLYDGSYARQSDPILMIPNSGYAPFISFKENTDNLTLYAFIADLQYGFLNTIDEKWRDIVSGIDVFVSQPVYPYNQGDNFDANNNRFSYAVINKTSGVDQISGTDYGYCDLPGISNTTQYGYAKHDLCAVAKAILGFADTDKQNDWRIVKLAPADDVMEKLQNAGLFYLIHSFDFDEIKVTDENDFSEVTTLQLKQGILSSLVARPTLSDDMLSNCRFFNAHLTAYNQRMHLFDFSLKHPIPSTPGMLNAQFYRYDSYGYLQQVQVYIRTARGERVVQYNADGNAYECPASMPWFFYPHNGAYKALLVYKNDSTGKFFVATLKLKQHSTLNGAYWTAQSLDASIPIDAQEDNVLLDAPADSSDYPNSVLQSPVNMPFAFPSELMSTIGAQRIDAMSSAAKALSEGQFGQFPLYAFTTEGVWALEVSSSGTYSARQPIARDVCSNPDGITQLDSAVLFPTDRGIMLIAGSQTQCISEAINSEYPFDATHLPGFTKLHAMLGHEPSTDKCLPTLPFSEFLKQCQMIYDYVHQRVIVYAPSATYAYIYSLKTQQWGMIFSRLSSHLNSYPEALAVDSTGAVLNFSVSKSEQVKCLYTTRPLKLEAANILKTIDNVIQRGFFRKGNVATALYGSRDLINWHLVWSSQDHYLRGFRGSPYKYFRIAGVATLSPDENIYGASVEFTPRQTNKPR